MNSFYNEAELRKLGLKTYGNNVLISRYAKIYSPEKVSIGSNVRIDDFCILSGNINLGNNIHIAAYSALYAGDAGIEMHDFSTISSRVTIYAVSDDYSGICLTNPMVPSKYRKIISSKVVLEKHVIIGSTSVILPGVILGAGSSFGSMSLITKSSDPWTVNVGIPAKPLKERNKGLLKLEEKLRGEKDE